MILEAGITYRDVSIALLTLLVILVAWCFLLIFRYFKNNNTLTRVFTWIGFIELSTAHIVSETMLRYEGIKLATKTFSGLDCNSIHENKAAMIVAADLSIERAQQFLNARARKFNLYGGAWAIASIVFLMYVYDDISNNILNFQEMEENTLKNFSQINPTIITVKTITLGLVVGITEYFMIGLAKSCFHEAAKLRSQRHALRFGRFYLYQKEGALDFQEMDKAFRWNDDFSSAFRDENFGKSFKVVEQVAETASKLAERLSKIKNVLNEDTKAKKDESAEK